MSKRLKPRVPTSKWTDEATHVPRRARARRGIAPLRRLRRDSVQTGIVVRSVAGVASRGKLHRSKNSVTSATDEAEIRVLAPKPMTKGTGLTDPLGDLYRLRDQIKVREDSVQRALYADLATCLDIKIALERDHLKYVDFTRDPFWNKKKKRPRARKHGPTLLFVLIFAFRAVSKGRITQMYRYKRVLEWLECQAVDIDDIADTIESHKGIQPLYKKIATWDPRRRRPEMPDLPGSDEEEDKFRVEVEDDLGPPDISELIARLNEGTDEDSPLPLGGQPFRYYHLAVPTEQADRFEALAEGKRGWLYFERTSFGIEVLKLRWKKPRLKR